MPMGLFNAPTTFQFLMNSIFCYFIYNFQFLYLDDLLIYSNSIDAHLVHLYTVLSRLQNHELYVGCSKSELLTTDTEFLGLRLVFDGFSVVNDRRRIVQD